jgi:hypothetical protein
MLTSSVLGMGRLYAGVLFSCFQLIIFHSVVEYATYDDMKSAMKKLDGAELNGRRLKLSEDYRGGRKRR